MMQIVRVIGNVPDAGRMAQVVQTGIRCEALGGGENYVLLLDVGGLFLVDEEDTEPVR